MYTNTCIWNLERWYWWNHFQGSNRDSDTEIKLVDTVGEEEGGRNWESSMEICTLPYVKQIASGNLLCDDTGSSSQCSVTTIGIGRGGRWAGRSGGRGHTYTWFMDSCGCLAEANTMLQSNYPPIPKKWNNCSLRTSLVVPWLRLPAFTVGDTISIPGQGTK